MTTRINGVWLFLRLTMPALWTTADGAVFDRVLDEASPAIQAVLDTVGDASAAELAWPYSPPRTPVTADTCREYLEPAALDAVIGGVKGTLKKGGTVTLVGFGTFAVGKRAARTGRNPRTGAAIKIKAAKIPKFRPGKALKDALN